MTETPWVTIEVRSQTRNAILDIFDIFATGQDEVLVAMPPDPDTGYAMYQAVEAMIVDEKP